MFVPIVLVVGVVAMVLSFSSLDGEKHEHHATNFQKGKF